MRRKLRTPSRAIATALALAALAATARGVVISGANAGPSQSAPSANPYWDNVAHLSGATAVYLGDRWMITANHVSETSVTFSDGRAPFAVVPGSEVVLTNPTTSGATGNADLRMFQLQADPGLPSLAITTTTPKNGAALMMIGAGRDRGATEIGWSASTDPWKPTPLPLATARGYSLASTSHMAWGESRVAGSTLISNNTVMLATNFSSSAGPFEAQVVTGDSGGGVFTQVGGAWQLTGVIDAEKLLTNQPSDTVVFGDQSYFANLSTYRDQIESILNTPTPPWQNSTNHFDVNRSGKASIGDILAVIHELETHGSHALSGAPGSTDYLYDVNGDGQITNLDRALIYNHLVGRGDFAPSSGTGIVPEPSSGLLAVLGLAGLWFGRRHFARKRRLANSTTA